MWRGEEFRPAGDLCNGEWEPRREEVCLVIANLSQRRCCQGRGGEHDLATKAPEPGGLGREHLRGKRPDRKERGELDGCREVRKALFGPNKFRLREEFGEPGRELLLREVGCLELDEKAHRPRDLNYRTRSMCRRRWV